MARTNTEISRPAKRALSTNDLAAVASLLRSGEVNDALADLEALEVASLNDPQVAYLFGVAHLQRNDGAAACEHLRRCRDARPDEADVHYHLGLAYLLPGTRDEAHAIESFQTALRYQPDLFSAGYELASLYRSRGDFELALECYIRAAHLAAENEHLPEATLAISEAMRLSPDSPELLVFAGRLLLAQDKLEEAATAYAKASTLAPDNSDILNELGLTLYRRRRDDEAERCYRQALGGRKIFPQAHNNLGNLYARTGESKRAVKHYRFAVAQLPGYSDAWYNLAREQLVLDDREGARESCERAVETGADAALARSLLADLLLAEGRYSQGWLSFESRVHANTGLSYHPDPRDPARHLPLPSTLDVNSFVGKRVLVIPEPSVGDELSFLRFIPFLRARGVDVEYDPSPALRPLLESNPAGSFTLRSKQGGEPDYAAIIASGDLPLLLGHGDGIPVPPPYAVAPHDDDVAEIAMLLDDLEPGPVLAITWRAGFAEDGPRRKALALDDVAKLVEVWPGAVVAVQRTPDHDDIAELQRLSGRTVHDFCSFNDDLARMAALLHVVDEYVGVSNTNMHLMTSLGNRARVFVKHPGEWRWQLQSPMTPWSPRAVLYRERRDVGWTAAWRSLLADLAVDYELRCD